MLKIRLQRTGKKHDPSYRVVLTDSRNSAQSGSFLEILGNYGVKKGETKFDAEKIKNWISKGAKVSDTVHNLLVANKIIEGKKKDVLHHQKIRQSAEKQNKEKQGEQKKEETKEEVKETAQTETVQA